MKRANLFVLGAQKSGTSSLHFYLKHLDAVYMCDAKETFFFTQDDWHDIKKYHQHYQNSGDARYCGESSTAYTMQPAYPNVAPRLYEYNPDARLIYIVRDPIDRAISNYWWNVYLCRETRLPLDAIKSDLQYQQTSDYAFQIQPYLDIFAKNQIYFVLFEEMRQSPRQTVSRLCNWLDISPDVQDDDIFSVVRRKTGQTIELIDTNTLLGKLRGSAIWQNQLRKFIPANFRRLGKPLATQVLDKQSPSIVTELEKVKAYLRPVMQIRFKNFERIAPLDFAKWTTLNP